MEQEGQWVQLGYFTVVIYIYIYTHVCVCVCACMLSHFSRV